MENGMSFMAPRSAISICNKALSRISQAPLTGELDDVANRNKHSARMCAIWYPSVVRRLLEQHHWGIATRRQPLALNWTNERSGEWLYAYQPPADMAFPVAVTLPGINAGGAAIGYYRGIETLIGHLYGRKLFQLAGGVLYSNTPSMELEFVSFNITEHDFTQIFEDMVVIFLAAQLARTVAKDEQLAQTFESQGTNELNRAIAYERNLGHDRYDQLPSEGERARVGLIDPALLDYRR